MKCDLCDKPAVCTNRDGINPRCEDCCEYENHSARGDWCLLIDDAAPADPTEVAS